MRAFTRALLQPRCAVIRPTVMRRMGMRRTGMRRTGIRLTAAVLTPLVWLPLAAVAQLSSPTAVELRPPAAGHRPFAAGERLTYVVQVAKFGTVGRGSLTVEGPVEVRGTDALLLRFTFRTRVGPFRVVNRTASWLDPVRMASLRFEKHERQPFSSENEAVELYPDERRWTRADGQTGESPSDAPLDELSFIYFIRTLPLDVDTTYRFDRHFDPDRSPTTVRVVGHDSVTTPAGTFRTVVVEMQVKDARHYRGDGVIRFYLTDDACRLPVRIESSAPVVGHAVFTLESHTHPATHLATHTPEPPR